MKRLLLLLLLAVTAGAALRAGDNVRVTHFDEGDGFAESRVTCMIQDSQGLIWFSTWDGLYRYDGYRMRNYKARPGDNCPLGINRIDYIRELADGRILCRGTDGYYTFDRQTRKFAALKGDRPGPDIRYMPDSLTESIVKGLDRYAGISVRIRFVDRQGGIWVYSNLGLDRVTFAPKPIANRKMGTGGEEVVRGLMEDRGGRLWVADKNGYVRVMSPDGRLAGWLTADGRITAARAGFGHQVYCMYEDSRGTIWIGTKFGGLFRLTPGGGKYAVSHYAAERGKAGRLSHSDIYAIAEDGYGRIWIGTYGGGLNLVESGSHGQPVFLNSAGGLPALHKGKVEIHCMTITPDNILLAGTNEGLFSARVERDARKMVFHNNRRAPADAASLSSNRVMDIIRIRGGQTYVATYGGGLCKLLSSGLLSDTLRFKPYTTGDGLASDVTLSAVEDRSGNIWIVSEASVSCMNPATGVFTNFKKSIFAGGFVLTEAHPLCLADGRIAIGTSQGTLEFNPGELRKSGYVPPIVTDCDSTVSLTPDERRLAIEMAALDYNKNERIEYAYRLDGVDSSWNYTTDNRIIYANIPAGTYTLHIKSTNGDGIWVDNERTIEISRTPHFNETPMAWMLYGGLLLAAVWAAVRVAQYIRRLQRELSDTKLTTNEKIEYVLLKSGEKKSEPDKEEPQPEEAREQDRLWAARVRNFLAHNIGDSDLTVDCMAREMGMSRSVFYLNMKRVFGVTPNNFIQDARINRAKKLLREHKTGISEVAYKCGFSDPKYFSRCFKKATGRTPSEYSEG